MNISANILAALQGLGLDVDRYSTERAQALGIDLGTTNSTATVAALDSSNSEMVTIETIEVPQGTREGLYIGPLMPSMVAVLGSTVFVGEGAKRLRADAARHGLRPFQSLFYECKNEIGLRKTYHKAPRGLRSAAEVGSKVLGALRDAARDTAGGTFDRVVVTVPASFRVAQRTDTIRAASLAGIELTGGDLLDEPLAAFLDYYVTHYEELRDVLNAPRTLVVFDFGGGTCDVAVFRLRPTASNGSLGVENLSVSRYHRLGGGDIDAAVVHEVLLPAIRKQNGLGEHDLTFEDKKRLLGPSLLGTAEALKLALCAEVRRLRAFERLDAEARKSLSTTQPVSVTISWREQELRLDRPTLTLGEFEVILQPFLDPHFLGATETEYRMTCSIFAPLRDALDRAGLAASDVDLCLLVGGSSLIPQIADAVASYFASARVLTYAEAADVKTCVGRGAALHALALRLTGGGLVAPSAGDSICVRHRDGHSTLVERGTSLPYPRDGGYAQWADFVFPETVRGQTVPLRIELTSGADGRLLHCQCVEVEGPVSKGDPLHIDYRVDANQVLQLRVRKPGQPPSEAKVATVENPFGHVFDPGSLRERIEGLEEGLRTREIAAHSAPETLAELSEMYAEIGQREKAAEYLSRALRMHGAPDEALLGRLARLYEDMGDTQRADRYYEEALRVGDWTGTPFNYAVALRRRGEHERAWRILEPALARSVEPPFFVLGALLREKLGDTDRAAELLEEAERRFDPVSSLNDWELGWYATAASMARDSAAEQAAMEEQRRRARRGKPRDEADPGGMLPLLPDREPREG